MIKERGTFDHEGGSVFGLGGGKGDAALGEDPDGRARLFDRLDRVLDLLEAAFF